MSIFARFAEYTKLDDNLWLVMLRQERVDATEEECELCVGLMGATLYAGLSGTVSQETVSEAMDKHRHYKTVDVEVLRLPAHSEPIDDGVRIVPEVDQVFTPQTPGVHHLAVHNADDVMLFRVDIGPMAIGSELSSMGASFELSPPC